MKQVKSTFSAESSKYCGLNTHSGTSAKKPRRCQNCGAHVDSDFARVCGDGDDRVHECLSCSTASESIARGAAAGLEARRHGGGASR
jgi:hypothetical protein